jgi:serine/threonine protein kinase/Tfp pilus assembly protein PilF
MDELPRIEEAKPPEKVTVSETAIRSEELGEKISHYKLLQRLGEGGCGVVYLAQQEEPIRRQVAFKVIKVGLDTRQVVARFEAERQALALMDHPNIARVLDAGSTQAGRPFFVMELVRGVKITDYCDQNKLPLPDRLNLFMQVCHAIQHAHQKGIIHRDIKPSNILTTVQDNTAVPKVIDFGIAKAAMGQQLAAQTLVTASGEFLGTPTYMSPEQIDLNAADIDTRADIYSLGVLLYEMLTGKTPFEHWDLVGHGLEQMRRTVREREPVRPSTRLKTMMGDELSTVARLRHADPPKLIQSVRGDLDWIVLKALEKDRTRRYSSASEFAGDIRRYLAHEPVSACPPTTAYRVRKFMRRHRAGTAIAAALAGAILFSAAATAVGLVRARRAETCALAEAQKAKAINQFLQDVLGSANPAEGISRDATVLEALSKATERIDQTFGQQPDVAAEVRVTIGTTLLRLGQYEPAEKLLRASLSYFERNPGPSGTNLVPVLNVLAVLRQERADYSESETLYRRALELRRKHFGERDPETLSIMANLSSLLTDKGDFAAAETLCRSAVAIRRQLPNHSATDLGADLNNLGLVLLKKGEPGAAAPVFEEAAQLLRREKQAHLGVTLGNLAQAKGLTGHFNEAVSLFQEAEQALLKNFGPSSQDLAVLRAKYGRLLLRSGDAARAEPLLSAALPVLRSTMGDQNDRTQQTISDLSEAYSSLGNSSKCLEYRSLLLTTNAPPAR